MTAWNGVARTNFFRVEDLRGLQQALDPFDVDLVLHDEMEDYYCLLIPECADYGGWPTSGLNDEGEEITFSFEGLVMPHLPEGEVLIAQEVGMNGMDYLTGVSKAYVRKGAEVLTEEVMLSGIYKKAAEAFGVSEKDIAHCSYNQLPENVEQERLANDRRLISRLAGSSA